MVFASRTVVLLQVVLLTAALSGKQANSQTTVGIQPFGSYSNGGFDQISQSDLGIHVDIPLFQHKARGNGMGVNAHLVYDSSYYGGYEAGDLGWRITLGAATSGTIVVNLTESDFYPLPCKDYAPRCTTTGYTNNYYDFAYIDSSGYSHGFSNATVMSVQCVGESPLGCTNVNLSTGAYADDNSGYTLSVNPGIQNPLPVLMTVTTPSGDVISYPYHAQQTRTDSNGNTGVVNPIAPAYWVDWAATLTDNTNVSETITGGAYPSLDHTKWTERHPLQVQYLDTSGNTQTIVINYTVQDVSYTCPSGFAFSQLIGLVSSIVYPDGSNYQFTYNQGGALASMQLPTGGTIAYPGNLGLGSSCGLGLPASLTRSTPDGNTTYTQTVNSTQLFGNYAATTTTNISYPDGGSEQIHFVQTALANAELSYDKYSYETYHIWYSAQNTVMKSTMKCYNGASGDCTTTPVSLPITQIATTTTLDNGLTSKSVEFLNSGGLVTEVDEYDFGASAPSRKTTTVYANLGNNIANRPASVTVFDASGNTASTTTYGYDEVTPTATSSLPGHNAVTGARGNKTSQHAWLNTPSGTIDSHWTYDDAGQVVSARDPLQHLTQYGYDTATDSCRISTTPPTPSSGVSQATSATCDPNTGLPISTTDANGAITSYTYDALLRPHGISASLGGVLASSRTTSYSGSSVPVFIATAVVASPSPTQQSTTTLDGLGRPVKTITPSGANVDTTYNSMGYVQSVSNPYFTTSDPTYGLTSYSYDALGRKVQQTNSDGSTQTWVYSGNQVIFTDELGNQWQKTADGFGRLTKVLEPNTLTQTPAMETDYSYDTLNNLLLVTQWGGANGTAGAITRSFSYDSLSRLLASSNPEAGSVGYTYDANSNVSIKTDARNVVTHYSYDELNRLFKKWYTNDASGTLYSCYSYDTSGNGVGRLAKEWTQSSVCSTPPTIPASPTSGVSTLSAITSYDAMGRIVNEQQCILGSCTSQTQPAPQLTYGYDLAGDLTSFGNSVGMSNGPLNLNSSFDAAGHLTSLTSDWTPNAWINQQQPAPMYTSTPSGYSLYTLGTGSAPAYGSCTPGQYGYGPVGPLSWNLGSSVTVAQCYTNRLWVQDVIATGQVPQ
jgi:YD repeat-containing protein